MKFLMLSLTTAFTVALVATPASAQERTNMSTTTMSSMDADGNLEVWDDEYYTYWDDAGMFSSWDTNGNGFIDEDEYGVFDFANDPGYTVLDVDSNGYLDSGEFYDGVWTMHDRDENGFWDDDEWYDFAESGLFDF